MKSTGVLFALLALPALADEGMWTLENFPAEAVESKYGVEIDQAWLDRVRRSTVRLENGCSGSFASDSGLILTNRHCLFSCLAEHTSAEDNVWRDGMVARHPGEERRCSTQQASVLLETRDVTGQVAGAIEGLGEAKANEIRKQTLTRLEQACEADADAKLSCEAVSLYNGGQYFIYAYRRFSDVRLVFAPEAGIGAFGGDPDNFNFPRWCLDAAVLRVYDDDGKPARTPDYLRWRADGAEAGEAVFIAGHPGSTQRLLTVAQLELIRNVIVPDWLLRNVELRGRYLQFATLDEKAARDVQNPLVRIENGIKVRRNELAALLDDRLMTEKRANEMVFRAAVAADPVLAAEIGDPWSRIDRAIVEYLPFRYQYLFIEAGAAFSGRLFNYARVLIRGAAERAKPSDKRLREFRDTALPRLEQTLLAATPIHPRLEQLQLSYSLDKMRELLGPDDAMVRKILGNESPAGLASTLVDGSGLADPAVRKELWDGGQEAIDASEDPMIRLARAIDPQARKLRKRFEATYEAPIDQAYEQIARARFAVYGTATYPDATFTLRVSYGAVSGWNELGKEIPPFTYLGRLYERNTGQPPFDAPERWLKRKPDLDMKTPFNFVSTIDITGGNSGSPLIDKDAKLVGLAFDGNRHSIAGAYWYDPDLNRAVSVHPAIMLEALEKVYDASYILGEINRDAGQ